MLENPHMQFEVICYIISLWLVVTSTNASVGILYHHNFQIDEMLSYAYLKSAYLKSYLKCG